MLDQQDLAQIKAAAPTSGVALGVLRNMALQRARAAASTSLSAARSLPGNALIAPHDRAFAPIFTYDDPNMVNQRLPNPEPGNPEFPLGSTNPDLQAYYARFWLEQRANTLRRAHDGTATFAPTPYPGKPLEYAI